MWEKGNGGKDEGVNGIFYHGLSAIKVAERIERGMKKEGGIFIL